MEEPLLPELQARTKLHTTELSHPGGTNKPREWTIFTRFWLENVVEDVFRSNAVNATSEYSPGRDGIYEQKNGKTSRRITVRTDERFNNDEMGILFIYSAEHRRPAPRIQLWWYYSRNGICIIWPHRLAAAYPSIRSSNESRHNCNILADADGIRNNCFLLQDTFILRLRCCLVARSACGW